MALQVIKYAIHNLEPGERIRYQSCPHWIITLKPALLLAIGIAVMAYIGLPDISAYKAELVTEFFNNPLAILFPIGAITAAQGAVGLIKKLLVILSTEITITSRRVIWKTGIIWRDTDPIQRARIEGCRLVNQSWLGQILNYGTIEIKSIGGNVTKLSTAKSPATLEKYINKPLPKRQPPKKT